MGDIEEKLFKVNEIKVAFEILAGEGDNQAILISIEPKVTETVNNYQELMNLLEKQRLALLMGLQKAETFENETNDLLKFLKKSENELEKIQTQLDQEQYTLLEEMVDEVERIKVDHAGKREDIDDNNFMGSEIITDTKYEKSEKFIQEMLDLIESSYADLNSFI